MVITSSLSYKSLILQIKKSYLISSRQRYLPLIASSLSQIGSSMERCCHQRFTNKLAWSIELVSANKNSNW